ncbi:CHC2 zinc finger domain-containing protein [Nocardia sp. NRRL S-836]|uniref:CHC2 zinc finger domain-containing protein n=1 Tax=Nocardia sp. NRRL S-836 TaxID=1519492 RepID=UPI00351024CD
MADVVAPYTTLTPLGEQQLRGDCPFCQSTMLRVRPAHGAFHCFGCGARDDARMFVAKIGRRP